MGTAMEIQSITFTASVPVNMGCYALDFSMSFAHTDVDQLSETFEMNYTPGSLIEVFQTDSLVLDQIEGETLVLELDTPFFYNGQDNLLIDIYYPSGYLYYSVWCWTAGSNRSLSRMFAPYSDFKDRLETGNLFEDLPWMIIEGDLGLDETTFGRIKVMLGSYKGRAENE